MYFPKGQEFSVVEAASWRLASELMRRHPGEARLIRGHPGGGQYDVLWIRGLHNSGLEILMNRAGTIQVHGRADGSRQIDWEPTEWADYLSSDPRTFVERLERAAGWPGPKKVPPSTPEVLTYRVLAALTSFGFKTVRPIMIEQGYIDTSGYGGGPNPDLEQFDLPASVTRPQDDDPFQEPGYRFWIPMREGMPLCAVEQSSATAWFLGNSTPIDLTAAYRANHKEPALVASLLLKVALDRA